MSIVSVGEMKELAEVEIRLDAPVELVGETDTPTTAPRVGGPEILTLRVFDFPWFSASSLGRMIFSFSIIAGGVGLDMLSHRCTCQNSAIVK